jgi:hypothetical protein
MIAEPSTNSKTLTQIISVVARWGNPGTYVSVVQDGGEFRSYLCGRQVAISRIPTRMHAIEEASLRLQTLVL